MYSKSEWGKVFWALAIETELPERMADHAELKRDEESFSASMVQFEREALASGRVVLFKDLTEKAVRTFLKLFDFFSCPYYLELDKASLPGKVEETLRAIDARVGEEPGIAY